MSTPMRNTFYPIKDAPYSKQFVVDKEQTKESLPDFVRRLRREKDLSLADVSNRSGGRIGRTHIHRIENGEAKGVSVEKLRALAKGLGVTDEEIFAVARGKKPEDDPDFLKSRLGLLSLKFDKVPIDKRVNVEALIDLLDREVERLTKK